MNIDRRIAVGAGALALLIGALGPWVSLLGVLHVGPTSNAEDTIVLFGGAALAGPIAVMVGWLVVGLALMWLGGLAASRKPKPAAVQV